MMLIKGQTLAGRYRVLDEIGHGGFGRVYLAEELERSSDLLADSDTLGLLFHPPQVLRRVALKTFSTRERLRSDLVTELRALCRLSHPHIVSVYDYQIAEPPFIVMEYAPGQDLQSRLDQQGSFGVFDALAIAQQVGEALAHAHAASILHRDIKPGNVIVTEDLRAKLVDFGLARNFEHLSHLTTRIGTPGFVAPELLDPERFRYPVSITADVYGFGCLLSSLLTGHSPFAGETPVEILRHQMEGRRRSVPHLPPLLNAVIERATALYPAERYPSIKAVLEQLRRIREGLQSQRTIEVVSPHHLDIQDGQVIALSSFQHPIRGQGIKFELGLPGGNLIRRGFLYQDQAYNGPSDLYQSLRCAFSGCELSLFSAIEVQSQEKGTFLSADDSTVPILQPHFLVSVTDLVKSMGHRAPDCPARPFVDERQPDRYTTPLFLGRLLHQLFDQLVGAGTRKSDFSELFEKALAESRITAVAAGLTDTDLPAIRRDAASSYRWLVQFVRSNVRRAGHLAEVTRFSGLYGLEGRIDLAILNPDRLDIVELKTGRRQQPDHEAQVRCYALLWDRFAAAVKRDVRGSLIYSRVGQEKAIPRLEHERERAIVKSRNEIVAAHFAVARGEFEGAMPHYGQWPERCQDLPCRYRRDRCRQQCTDIGLGPQGQTESGHTQPDPFFPLTASQVSAARAYYRHFARLIELEYLSLSQAQGEFTRIDGLAQRIEEGTAVDEVTLKAWDPGARAVRLDSPNLQQLTPGTDVIVHRGDPERDFILLGRVELVDAAGAVIAGDGIAPIGQLPRDRWVVERLSARIGYREAHQAIYSLLTTRDPERLGAILFGTPLGQEENSHSKVETSRHGVYDSHPNHQQTPHQDEKSHAGGGRPAADRRGAIEGMDHDASLNPAQRHAVALALEENRPVLIQGPPGTGKTTVIAHVVLGLVTRGKRVLISAGTNTAVDNILLHLVKAGIDFVRLGYLEPESALKTVLTPAQIEHQIARDLGRSEPSLDAIADRFRTVAVVAGTAHRCVRSSAMEAIKRHSPSCAGSGNLSVPFDVALVDEATQLIEPLALGVVLLARRFVLVGDRRQLPPVVTSDEARSAYVRDRLDDLTLKMNLSGLDYTLFERLSGRTVEASLDLQYRMNSQIQELSNRLYYAGALRAHPEVSRRHLWLNPKSLATLSPPIRDRLDPNRPLVWESLDGEPSGRRNQAEVDQVVATIRAIFESRAAPSAFAAEIGVITPFRAQSFAIRRALADTLGESTASAVEVDTVERFQGREKEVMFVSLVVSQWSDFVMDARRLNVAFTRARSKLIVFGPRQILYRFQQGIWTGKGSEQEDVGLDKELVP